MRQLQILIISAKTWHRIVCWFSWIYLFLPVLAFRNLPTFSDKFFNRKEIKQVFFSLIVYFHDHMYTKMTFILNCIYCIPLQKECVSVHFGLRLFNNLAYLENFMKTTMLQLTDLNCKIKFKNLNNLKKGFLILTTFWYLV